MSALEIRVSRLERAQGGDAICDLTDAELDARVAAIDNAGLCLPLSAEAGGLIIEYVARHGRHLVPDFNQDKSS